MRKIQVIVLETPVIIGKMVLADLKIQVMFEEPVEEKWIVKFC